MTKDQLIEQLQASDAGGIEEVVALSSDGIGFNITGISMHRGLLCVTEGDEIDVWPELEAADDTELEAD